MPLQSLLQGLQAGQMQFMALGFAAGMTKQVGDLAASATGHILMHR